MKKIQSTDNNKTVQHQNISRDYTLNKSKALTKKLDATRSEHLSFKLTGGGLRLFFSTSSFEVFKRACTYYYEHLNTNGGDNREIAFIPISDKNNKNAVEEQIKVSEKGLDSLGRSIKRKSYCINIYFTTSSVLINGKGLNIFCETDLPVIVVKMKECQINGKDVNLNELNKIFEEVILMEKQGKEDCNNNSVIDVDKTEHLNPGTIQISNPNNNTIKSIKEDVSSNTNREPSTSSVAIPIINIPDDIQAQVKDINPTNSEDKSTCLDGTGNNLPQLNIQDFVTTLDKLTTVVTNLKDKVDELEISIQANNLSNASSIQILNDRMTALAKVRMQHDQQSMNKMQDIEAEIQNVNKNLEKKVNMLQGKTQSISDKIKLYEVETIKLQKSFMPEENLGNQCTPMLDEDQTIPKTTCETILQEHPHELEQSINADINEEPQNPVYDTQPKLPLSGSRVLIAGSSVLKGIDPSKLKDYIDVHVHRGANVLDLYEDIRSMDLSSYNTIIIHVGGNDASSKMNVQQFVDIFQEIINFVRCQNCRAIVSGILPRIQCDVTEYNTILKQMCHYNDVKFISNYESFVYKDDHIAKSFYTTDGIHLNRYGTIKLLANVNKVIKVFKGKQIQHHLNQQNRNIYQSSSHQYYANNFRRSPAKPRYQSRSNMNTTDRRNFNHSRINPRNVKDRNDLNMNSRDSWENNNELNRQNVDRAPFFNNHSPNSVRKSDYVHR
ncbi:unnamed protein product [Mytilus edulis]|uniref:SGNH hydrolase-type esterase domain-containing protein n=1 Tax=Mytilus edulis TaxID=6550 RepID=A0A8S3RI55_MYTED|nr:unnamed protein product [Mytilus edulis]